MKRGYQYRFSATPAGRYELSGRERKAETMYLILSHHFGKDRTASLSVLDVGASLGVIDHHLARYFHDVTGIDIDDSAIAHAKSTYSQQENLEFAIGDAMEIPYANNRFDVVICSQVYEHVPDAACMMREIFRVLKPGGICYFAAGNRLSIHEPHYHLPFLSVIPRPLAHIYIRLSGKSAYYYEKHLSYWGLRSLVSQFEIIDYTLRTLEQPALFGVDYMIQPGSLKQRLACFITRFLPWLTPGYLWLLRKPGNPE